jgi:mono/diheme cytochrome c family protein
MKVCKIILLALVSCVLIFSFAFATTNVEKGKTLFNDPMAFGGKSGKSCGTCHPNGNGLENATTKKVWTNPAGKWTSLEDAINVCIVLANKGAAIDPKSEQMKDLVAYIRSLGKKKQ